VLPLLAEEREAGRRELDNLRFAMDQHAIVSVTDTAGRILSVNDKFCEISGYSREELLGQDHRIVNSGHHPRSFFENLWGTIAAGRVWHGEIRNRAKDGRLYWVEATIVPFLDERGAPVKYVAARTDVTALKEMQARTRALVENLLEGLLVLRTDFVIEDLNPAAERIFGYRREELAGRSVRVLLPDEPEYRAEGFLERAASAISTGRWSGAPGARAASSSPWRRSCTRWRFPGDGWWPPTCATSPSGTRSTA